MVKHSRKRSRIQKRKSSKRTTKKMVGGVFSPEENEQLIGMGFTDNDITFLSNEGVGLNIIQSSLNQVNPATGNFFTPEELIQSMNEANDEINQLDISGISNASDEEHNFNDSFDDSMNTTTEDISLLSGNNSNNINNNSQGSLHLSDLNVSNNGNNDSQGSLHLSDLNVSNNSNGSQGPLQLSDLNEDNTNNSSQGSLHLSDLNDNDVNNSSQGSLHLSDLNVSNHDDDSLDSVNTTRDYSFGGKKRRTMKNIRIMKKRRTMKKRRIMKKRKTMKKRKSRKQRGGMCFGNGVGANSYDPNFSIYNTRELTLFPYKPTN